MSGRGGGCVWVLRLLVVGLMMLRQEVLSCGDAVSALNPCGSFLLGMGHPKPSDQCCSSAQALNKMAVMRASRVAVCECFKFSGTFLWGETCKSQATALSLSSRST
ncbi:hypothetical protein NE237_001264 [Protea cynaroides]|uniref:Bifunctional inhibitor/plant lipid transfer protein/seed storage helical domain-containing protein n=1 Tax=Protea cynaroides TaxID=273540 RepID=A0A9Q0KSS2_9MAGN|nr:hypothetical protein NE237_001264 [Protea cynaroides]